MASKQHQVEDGSRSESTSCLPFVLRITWMMIGNLGLFICAALIAQGIAPGVSDLLLFLVAGGLIAVRYVDITRFEGQTSDCEPATSHTGGATLAGCCSPRLPCGRSQDLSHRAAGCDEHNSQTRPPLEPVAATRQVIGI
jgi:hypothetical protein